MGDNSGIDLSDYEVEQSSSSSDSDSSIKSKRQRIEQCVSKLRSKHRALLQKMPYQDFLPMIANHNFVCSTTPLSLLRKITIRESARFPRKTYKGGYLILRTLETPLEDDCLNTVVEDDEGTGAIFNLYNVGVTPHPDMEDSWPAGTIFFLKEPYCPEMQNGTYCLNCKSPSDVVFVYDRPDLLELTHQIRWASKVDDPMYRQGVPESAEEWLALGSALESGDKIEIAMRCYNLALNVVDRLPEKHLDLRLKIYSNLCNFYYSKDFYEKALTFAGKVMDVDHTKEEVCVFATMCNYYLRNYEIARHFSQFSLNGFPDYRNLDLPLDIPGIRHLEMLCGKFDMHQMFLAQRNHYKPINCPDYTGPIRKVAIEGKGRGVITTRKIRPGTLLVVSKALAFSRNVRICEWWQDLVAQLSSLIAKNPKTFGPIIYSLFDGFNPVEEGNVKVFCSPETEQEPIVDILKLKGIVVINAIGDTDDIHVHKSCGRKRQNRMPGCGVYDMPSYFNHSCLPNASLHEYNDLVFIRAIKSIEVGEEVCIPYVSWNFPFKQRKEMLSIFGFECVCELCQQECKATSVNIYARYEIQVKRRKIYSQITSTKAVFENTILEEIDDMLVGLISTYENRNDFSLNASMSTLYSLRAKAYAMASCCHPEKMPEEIECHLITLSCLGLDPDKLLTSLENGACLIPKDAILDESVLFACCRLIYLYHSLSKTTLGKTWTWVLIALEKIYSGEDVNVLKLRYPYLKVYFDALKIYLTKLRCFHVNPKCYY